MAGRVVGFDDSASISSSSSDRVSGHGEIRRGTTDRKRLYGGNVIPIAVPVLPDETFSDHERSFLRWLTERGIRLKHLRDDPNKERSLRTSFAVHKLSAWNRGEYAVAPGKRGRADEDSETERDGGSSRESSAKRPHQDRGKNAAVLLRQRVLAVSEYREEAQGPKLTTAEKLKRYGCATEPIPVPLFPGETIQEYEKRFLAFLGTLSMDINRLGREPNTERSVRLLFARKRLTGGRPTIHETNPVRIVEVATPPAVPKPPILSRVSGVPKANDSDSVYEAKSADQATPNEGDPKLRFPTQCTMRPPPTESDDTSIPKAYLACGCRMCLLRCTSRLARQVADLQRDLDDAKATRTDTMNSIVMDLTRDTDTPSTAASVPPSPASITSVDVSKMLQIAALIKSRRHTSTLSSTRSRATANDPIEEQLRSQYDEINERVSMNERVLENASLELQDTTLTEQNQVHAASMTHDENLELRSYIEEEKDHRDAALAILIVYMWRQTPHKLRERLEHPSTTDVAHVIQACHHKLLLLATELSEHEIQAAALKDQLDTVLSESLAMETSVETEETQRLEQLAQLGEQLTTAETAMTTIWTARQREITTLLHFDGHIRRLVTALLAEVS